MSKPDDSLLVAMEMDTEDCVSTTLRLDILDQKSLQTGVMLGQQVKSMVADIEETFDPHIAAAHKQHKQLIETKNKFVSPLVEAEALIKRKLSIYLEDYPGAQAKGLSVRDNVSIDVVDLMKLVRSIGKANSVIPVECVKPDTAKIKKLVTAGFKVPGVEVKNDPVVSIRK